MSFLAELRRRNVFKVGGAYAVVAWLLAQVVADVFPLLQLPIWTSTFVIALLLIGFPIALVLAWAFEVTPTGIKRTDAVPLSQSIRHITGQKLNYIVTGLLVIAVLFMATDRYFLAASGPAAVDAAGSAGAATGSPAAAAAPSNSGTTDLLANSIAVLPFTNFSPNPDDAFFAAGIHEEILNYLVKLKSLNVINRTSMQRYAETDKSVQEIASELKVRTIMEGSVRYANDRVRVTTQLIEAATGVHLWSETYERDFKDIFAIQTDIAMNVANALDAEFSPQEQQRLEVVPDVSPETYAAYLKILPRLGALGNQGPNIISIVDGLIAKDPNFAPLYGVRAAVYANSMITTTYGFAGDRRRMESLARSSAERALALDPHDYEANSALAAIDMFSWHWAEARQRYDSFNTATGRNPEYRSWFEAWSGRAAAAEAIARRATELSPFDTAALWWSGVGLASAGNYDLAGDYFRRAIEIVPEAALFHSWLAHTEIARGRSDAALRELQVTEQSLGNNRALIYVLDLLYSYGRLGRSADAERLFAEVQGIAASQDIGAGGWAMAYLCIRDREKALEQLRLGAQRARNKELDAGFFQLMNIRQNILRDPLLEQSDFTALRAELNGF